MNEQYLMLSLPNSGSTWFADVISKHIPGCRYYDMEFFNPLRNERHEHTLTRQFGCELANCFRNIAEPGDEWIDGDIDRTWGTEDYNFTKEVFSPFKLPVFARHFRCFVLLRSPQDSFPPTRLRIWSFYEHAWIAMKESGHKLVSKGARERALEAHCVMSRAIEDDARNHGVPVIYYNQLFGNEDALRNNLERVFGFELDGMIDAISQTRKFKPRAASA